MADTKISGFDMRPTIEWYAQNYQRLNNAVPSPNDHAPPAFEYNVSEGICWLTLPKISALIDLFPLPAQARSILASVSVKPPLWFHRDSVEHGPKPTTNMSEALSPTAIIPSYIGYTAADKTPGYLGNIDLYEIPNISPFISRLVHAQCFVHEFGHSILKAEAFWDAEIWGPRPKLRFPNGRLVDGDEVLAEYRTLADAHPPISHYATAYVPEGRLKTESSVPVEEAMVEAMAAHLLGFAFRTDGSGLEPFQDRQPLRQYITDFLMAERMAS